MGPEIQKKLEEMATGLDGAHEDFMRVAEAAWELAVKTEKERCAELLQAYKELGLTPNVDVIINDILNPEGG